MIKQLYLKDFRIFKEQTINIGETLTAIAGQNATGKSTILSIIGNSCALPEKEGKLITGKPFQTEFSEIMKGSKVFDKKTGIIGHILYSQNGIEDKLKLRVTWQKKKPSDTEKNRFRVIPKKKNVSLKRGYDEKKLNLPSYYIGLSRLYPIGEADKYSVLDPYKLSSDDENWLKQNYSNILSINTEINSISNFKINNKLSGGINTGHYDFLTNSSGQDNLMQILHVVLSFIKLHEKHASKKKIWNGGLFLIDEIDSTLHPAAQIKLIKLLYNFSKTYKVQVLFTTHSLQLLKYVSSLLKKGDVCITYLTTANNTLEIETNPKYELMENDMNISSFYSGNDATKLTIYSEDNEARWFIKKLLYEYLSYVNLPEIKLGSDSLMSLLKNDPNYFKNVMFILDGDKSKEVNNNKSESPDSYYQLSKRYCNILCLPGDVSPEEIIFNYLSTLKVDHPILTKNKEKGISIRYFNDNNPLECEKYKDCKERREKYKKWFIDNLLMLEEIDVFFHWKNDNLLICDAYKDDFIQKYNILANRSGLINI